MDFFGSTICCCGYRARLEATRRRAPWFAALAACTLMQFGGTTLVGAALSSGHAVTSWGADKAVGAMWERPRGAVFSTLMAGAFGASGARAAEWDASADMRPSKLSISARSGSFGLVFESTARSHQDLEKVC